MVRLLLTVFFVGLVVSCACWVAVEAMGGPDGGPSLARTNGHWQWGDRKWDTADDVSDGTITTRDIPWSGTDHLEISVPAQIYYTQGPDAKVTITGPKDLIDRITINDGAIDYERTVGWVGHRGRSPYIQMTIQAPGVKRFELNGSEKLTISAYSQDLLDLEANGASKINASGQANKLHMELNGASSGDMRSLTNDDADVELNGASSVTIAPRLSAKVEINGVGHARLLTRPANMQKEINGIGSITYDTDSSSTPVGPLPSPGAAKPSQAAPQSRPKTAAT
jgi:hypothetical protein